MNITTPVVAQAFARVIEPDGGLERLAATGVELPQWQLDLIRQADQYSVVRGLLNIRVYPVENDGQGNIRAVGRCPWCKRLHQHYLGGDMLRRPECIEGLPPFDKDLPKPDSYALVVALDIAPLAIRREMGMSRRDMLFIALQAQTRKKLGRALWRVGLSALIDCGALDDDVSRRLKSGISTRQAKRSAIAAAVRESGPGPWRLRLSRALMSAYHSLGQPDAR